MFDAFSDVGIAFLGVITISVAIQGLLAARGRGRGPLRKLPGWAAWTLWAVALMTGFGAILPIAASLFLCPLAGCDGALGIAVLIGILAIALTVFMLFAAIGNSRPEEQRLAGTASGDVDRPARGRPPT